MAPVPGDTYRGQRACNPRLYHLLPWTGIALVIAKARRHMCEGSNLVFERKIENFISELLNVSEASIG